MQPRNYYSKQQLDAMLGIEAQDADDAYDMSWQDEGAGLWNRWRSYMQNQAKAMQQFDSVATPGSKPKIILAVPVEGIPDEKDLALISSLIEHYEVYPWTGTLNRPVTTSAEFWKMRDAIRPDNVAAVREQLPKLGLAASDYLVIDPEKYTTLLKKPHQLDLTITPIGRGKNSLKQILLQYKSKGFKSIKLYPPDIDDIIAIQECFPDIELEITHANQKWLEKCSQWESVQKQKLFKGYSLVFSNYQSAYFPGELSAKNLKINIETGKPDMIDFTSRDHELESFILDGYSASRNRLDIGTQFYLQNVANLKKIDCQKVCFYGEKFLQELPQLASVESISLKDGGTHTDAQHYLKKFPNLKEYTVAFKQTQPLIIDPSIPLRRIENTYDMLSGYLLVAQGTLATLEEMKMAEFVDVDPVCPKLTKLTYQPTNRHPQCIALDEKHFPVLDVLGIHMGNNKLLRNIHTLTKLRLLSIRESSSITELQIPKSLLALKVEKCVLEKLIIPKDSKLTLLELERTGVTELDLTAHTSLQRLVLKNNIQFHTLKLPPSLKEVIIEDFKVTPELLRSIANAELKTIKMGEFVVTAKRDSFVKYTNMATATGMLFPEARSSAPEIEFTWDSTSPPAEMKFNKASPCKHLKITLKQGLENNLGSLIIEQGKALETLTLENCDKLRVLSIPVCPTLRVVSLKNCGITAFPENALPNLEEITIEGCENLSNIDFSLLPNLKRLKFSMLGTKKTLPSQLETLNLPKLESLTLYGNASTNLTEWKEINLTNCPNLKSFYCEHGIRCDKILLPPELEKLYVNIQAKTVDCLNAHKLKDVYVLTEGSLSHLNAPSLTKLSVIGTVDCALDGNDMPCLQRLEVSKYAVQDIKNMDKCTQLRVAELQFFGAANVTLPESCVSRTIKDYTPKQTNQQQVSPQMMQEPFRMTKTDIETIQQPKAPQAAREKPEIKTNDPDTATAEQAKSIALTDEVLKQDYNNKINPVSCLSIDDVPPVIEVSTGIPRIRQATGEIRVTLTKKGGADKRMYRWKILDKIVMDDTTVRFEASPIAEDQVDRKIWPSFDKAKFLEMENFALTSDEHALGHLHADMERGKRYPLAAGQALEYGEKGETIDIYCNSKPPVTLKRIWDKNKKQFYVELDEKGPAFATVDILYSFRRNKDYNNYPTDPARKLLRDDAVKKSISPLLREKILEKIKQQKAKKQGQHMLDFLLEPDPPKLSPEEEISLLKKWCEDFDRKSPLVVEEKSPTELDILASTIAQGIGGCAQSTQTFMIIAQMRGIPARYLRAENHASIEIPFVSASNAKETDWYGCDLGGRESYDNTPEEARKHLRDDIDKLQQASPSSALFLPEQKLPPLRKPDSIEAQWADRKKHEAIIRKIYQRLTEPTPVNSAMELLVAKTTLSPLIYLAAEQNAYDVNKQIVAELKRQKKYPSEDLNNPDYLFINSPRDFEEFLHPCQIDNGERRLLKNGGPLAKLIAKGGTLLVNWSNFSVSQIATYKSILDTSPTLSGLKVSEKLKVIGMAKTQKEEYQAFSSRCQPFVLADGFLKAAEQKRPEKIREHKRAEPLSIHLFNRLDWHEKIYGAITPGDRLTLLPGQLMEAIKNNQPVVLHDVPNDEEFNTLIRRIRDEGMFLYNGKMIPIPENFTIDMIETRPVLSLPTVNFLDKPDKRRHIYLSLNDFHRLYEEVISKENGDPDIKPGGLLEEYDINKHIFYFTESIPQSKWRELLHHISQSKALKDKPFDCKLAPGVVIKGVAKGPALLPPVLMEPAAALKQPSAVMLTNDPDFMCTQLQNETKDGARVFHVTTRHHFGNLIAGRMPDINDPGNVKLRFKMSPLLRDLIEGRNVILTGNISPTLYHQLLPLLSGDPRHVECNGEYHKIEGKLFVVVANTLGNKIKPHDAMQCHYQLKDYLAAFPDDAKLVEQANLFIEQARKLPHAGVGIPKQPPELSFELLKNMLQLLKDEKSELHRHNPVKSTILYHYPDNSEHYAYLNVMGKVIFRPDDPFAVRTEKLKKIIKENNLLTDQDYKNNIWKLLNCFSGKELMEIFKQNWQTAINTQGFPELTPEIFTDFRTRISNILASGKEEKAVKRLHVDKRELELSTYLADKNCQIITLMGLAGVGKTEVRKSLETKANHAVYKAETQILEWLEDKRDDVTKVLFIDEINTTLPDTYLFLKELRRGFESGQPRKITFKDKEYLLSDKHKILATGNPTSYAERFQHELIEKYGRTIYFKMPDDVSIKAMIDEIKPLPEAIHDVLLSSFHLARTLNPTYTYSLRDIINAAKRFNIIATDHSVAEALEACKIEFLGTFYDAATRTRFLKALEDKFKIPLEEKHQPDDVIAIHPIGGPTRYYPAARAHIINAIRHDLKMRDAEMKSTEDLGYFKKMVLLEGAPGLGKSTLYEAILREQGFSPDHPAASGKKYYVITQDNAGHAAELLRQAFHEGAVVILDEINVGTDLEKLINKIVTEGIDDNNKKSEHPGCLILGTDNPSSILGIKAVAASFMNRCHVLQMPANTPAELTAIAKKYGVLHPELLVAMHQQFEKSSPQRTNARTFFTAMVEYMAEVELSKQPEQIRPFIANLLWQLDEKEWPSFDIIYKWLKSPAQIHQLIKDILLLKEAKNWPTADTLFQWVKTTDDLHHFIMMCADYEKLNLKNLQQNLLKDSPLLTMTCHPQNIAMQILHLPRDDKDRQTNVDRILQVYRSGLPAELSQLKMENFYGVILQRCLQHESTAVIAKPIEQLLQKLKATKTKHAAALETIYHDLILLLEARTDDKLNPQSALKQLLAKHHAQLVATKGGRGSGLAAVLQDALKQLEKPAQSALKRI